MKFVCANANLIQGVNLDTDYDYITAKAKSHVLAIETLANSFAKSKSDCVLFVWDTDDPNDLVRATEQASLENINFKEVIDDLKHYIDFSVLGDFDFRTLELDGYTISVVKYVTMNNLRESARKSLKEVLHYYDELEDFGFVYQNYSGEGKNFHEIYYYKGNKQLPFRISSYGDKGMIYLSFMGDYNLEKKYDLDRLNGVQTYEFKNKLKNFTNDLDKILSDKKPFKESSDIAEKIASEIDKSYWIDKLIDDLDRHYEAMEKAWLKNLDKLSDEDILGIIDDCMGKSKTLVGKSEMLKNKMIDDLSKAYDDYIDDIDRQIRIGKSEDEVKEMIESTLENDIKMYLKLAYNNKASSNYFMVKFAEDNLI